MYPTRTETRSFATGSAATITFTMSFSGLDIQVDDILLLFVHGLATAASSLVPSPPVGWERVQEIAILPNIIVGNLFWKVATGSESDVSVTHTESCYGCMQLHIIRGGRYVTGQARPSSTSTPDPKPMLGQSDSDNLYFSAVQAHITTAASGYPVGYLGGLSTNTGGGINGLIASAYKESNSGFENPGSFTLTGAATEATWTVCVSPTEEPNKAFRVSVRGIVVGGGGINPGNYENISLAGLDIRENDIILIIIGTASDPGDTPDVPVGWNLVAQGNSANSSRYGGIFYKLADGTETIVSFTGWSTVNTGYINTQVWRNVGVPTSTRVNASGANYDPPNHDSIINAEHIWLAVAVFGTNTGIVASAAPINYIELFNMNDLFNGNWCPFAISHRYVVSVSENPGAFTNPTAGDGNVFTLEMVESVAAVGGGGGGIIEIDDITNILDI